MTTKESATKHEIQRLYATGAYKAVEAALTAELRRLVDTFGVGHDLELYYKPSVVKRRHDGRTVYVFGEVVDKTLCVYRWTGVNDARQTLIHEYFEYLISSVQEHRDMASNAIVTELMTSFKRLVETYGQVISNITYDEKERIIDTLTAGWLKKRTVNGP